MSADVIHFDCVVCRTDADKIDGPTAVIILLRMLHLDLSAEEVTRDLCFYHRRAVTGARTVEEPDCG